MWNLEALGVGYFLIIRILNLDLFADPAILHCWHASLVGAPEIVGAGNAKIGKMA